MIHINKSHHRGKYNNAKTGKYIPLNPQKYTGTEAPVFKSSLEHRMMLYLDKNPDILKWSYESLSITYLDRSVVPPKKRKYYIDFVAYARMPDNSVRTLWIEVKDSRETKKPKSQNIRESKTYAKNLSKWQQAAQIARQNNADFKIITEEQLK